jgi:uncharacterized membrane protein
MVTAMAERNWEREVNEALAEEARREASILHNPRLARVYVERGVAIGLFVVLTYGAAGLKWFNPEQRNLFFVCSIVGAAIAGGLVSIGIVGLFSQRTSLPPRPPRDNDLPPIGW